MNFTKNLRAEDLVGELAVVSMLCYYRFKRPVCFVKLCLKTTFTECMVVLAAIKVENCQRNLTESCAVQLGHS